MGPCLSVCIQGGTCYLYRTSYRISRVFNRRNAHLAGCVHTGRVGKFNRNNAHLSGCVHTGRVGGGSLIATMHTSLDVCIQGGPSAPMMWASCAHSNLHGRYCRYCRYCQYCRRLSSPPPLHAPPRPAPPCSALTPTQLQRRPGLPNAQIPEGGGRRAQGRTAEEGV